jgi:hypothetical protein
MMTRGNSYLRRELIVMAIVLAVVGVSIALVVLRDSPGHQVVSAVRTEPASPAQARHEAPRSIELRDTAPSPTIAPPPALAPRVVVPQDPAPTPKRAEQASAAKKKDASKPPQVSKKDGPDRPLPRQALDLVGADPVAEAIWMQAINDPSVSPHDRQDLIEDLNENGFDDPAHPSADDLPLIENRLAIIEALAPLAMDDVNAAAFEEAYKDLVNMHARALAD